MNFTLLPNGWRVGRKDQSLYDVRSVIYCRRDFAVATGRSPYSDLRLSLKEEQLLVEVAPGKNRILYLWGHLTAIHDGMFSVVRLGERRHPALDAIFIPQPDRSMRVPESAEIAMCWEAVHTALLTTFTTPRA